MDKHEIQYKKLTETPIPKLIIGLAIPTTISMLVTSFYNMADTFFVGKYGTSASGAVGIVFGLMAIIQAFGFMFGQGAGSICSRALGAKNDKKATKMISTGFFAAFVMGIIIMVLGLIFLDPFMRLLGSTDTILPYARTYAIYILLAAPFMCSSCVLNNGLRYEGQSLFSMIGLGTGAILNIFGDWLLMSKFKLGVTGAGISTAVTQIISFCLLLSVYLRGKTSGSISIKQASRKFEDLIDIIKTGFPSLVRQGLISVSTMFLNDRAGIYGDAAVAAMAIVNRICFFTFATALGIGQGFQPVSAFNYGAKKYMRVRSAFLFSFLAGEVFLGTVAMIGLQFTESLVGLFRDDADVIAIGTFALTVQFFGQLFQPFAVCTNMMFQSVGKTKIAIFISMLRSGLIFIPILYVFSYALGLRGVQMAQGITDVLTMAVAMPFTIKFLRELKQKSQQELA